MKVKKYTKINESSTSGKDSFKRNLIAEYGNDYLELPLTNKDGNNFLLFKNPISILEKEFEKTCIQTVELRSENIDDYLNSGYIVSEINSSLRAEGVNSSRKMVDDVIKAKKDGKRLEQSELVALINNYYDALRYVIGPNIREINEENINTLYRILTSDISSYEKVEVGSFYRQGEVSVGEDKGMDPKIVSGKINELVNFINSKLLEDKIHTKALISHYAFENIHPYYDFNGRLGRLLHLWILWNKNRFEFWKMVHLSETVFAYKQKIDSIFRRITKAKKNDANIDVTYFVGKLYEYIIESNGNYIKMKKMVNSISDGQPSRHMRLFIMDLLNQSGLDGKWYKGVDFKKLYPDYSKTTYDRFIKEVKESELFEKRGQKPLEFRLKK